MNRKLIFFLSFFFFLFSSVRISYAQVNIINDWSGGTINQINKNFGSNAFVIVAADPNDNTLIEVINSNSFNWVIRGHSHWLPIGSLMLNNPSEAVDVWVNFLSKINKNVYFEPWNEPARRDTECGNLSISECGQRVKNYINLLSQKLPGNVTLTSPAWDPYHPETGQMANAIGNIPYSVISTHVYSPQMARDYRNRLTSLGIRGASSMQIILTETGALENGESGSPTYDKKKLCEMYCTNIGGKTTIDFWNQEGVKFALFSFAPGDYGGSWDLWSADCVINALKGECQCDTCKENIAGDIQDIINRVFNRSVKKVETKEARVSRNWFSGAATINNDQTLLQRLFSLITNTLFKLPGSLEWEPADRAGRKPAEDVDVNYHLSEESIFFKGGMGEFCIPPNVITHSIKFFPGSRPLTFTLTLLNKLSTNHYVFAGLSAFEKMINWYTGFAYDENLPYLDLLQEENQAEMLKRMSNLLSGFASNVIPGEMYPEMGNELAADNLLSAGEYKPQKDKNDIALLDRPLFWMCQGGGILKESDFTKKMNDGRIDRTYAEGCADNPVPVNASTLFCYNPDFFTQRGLSFETNCAHAPDWGKSIAQGMESVIYGPYMWRRLVTEGLVSQEDLPIYFESCYPTEPQTCQTTTPVYDKFFGDMDPEDRFRVSPVEVTNSRDNPPNTFITKISNQCWTCQITKLYIPHLLGLVDACDKMTSMFLPGETYKEMKKDAQKETVIKIPCGASGVKADGSATGKANEDYNSPLSIRYEGRNLSFVSASIVNAECEEGTSEEGVPNRCSGQAKIVSRDRIYVPYYNRIRQCMDFLLGVQSGENKETIESLISDKTGGLDVKDTPLQAVWNDIGGVSSGLDESTNKEEEYRTNPNGLWGSQKLSRKDDAKVLAPGGLSGPLEEITKLQYIPGEMQEGYLNNF